MEYASIQVMFQDIITNKDANIQEAAADALYAALESNLTSVPGVLTSLMDLYNLLYKQVT